MEARLNIFFDVDLTIVSPFLELRPQVREVFGLLRQAGHRLYLWSAGGKSYTEFVADRLQLRELVEECLSKRDPVEVAPDYCVDDMPEYVAPLGYQVRPYVSGSHQDLEMLDVLRHILAVTHGSSPGEGHLPR